MPMLSGISTTGLVKPLYIIVFLLFRWSVFRSQPFIPTSLEKPGAGARSRPVEHTVPLEQRLGTRPAAEHLSLGEWWLPWRHRQTIGDGSTWLPFLATCWRRCLYMVSPPTVWGVTQMSWLRVRRRWRLRQKLAERAIVGWSAPDLLQRLVWSLVRRDTFNDNHGLLLLFRCYGM